MAQHYNGENRRYGEQSERGFAESILGSKYTARVYSREGNIARGTVMIDNRGAYCVHNAYAISDGEIGTQFVGTAIGVIKDRESGSVSVVLASDGERVWNQHDIAEALEYYIGEGNMKIFSLHEKSCGAVVFTEDGGERKYLIIRMNLGHCGLPKGHVEKYESEEETAIREVKEETGVEITLIEGFRTAVEYSLTARTKKESVYFLGRFVGDDIKIQEAEVSSYRLCPYEQARKLITYENDRTILDAAESLLRSRENA